MQPLSDVNFVIEKWSLLLMHINENPRFRVTNILQRKGQIFQKLNRFLYFALIVFEGIFRIYTESLRTVIETPWVWAQKFFCLIADRWFIEVKNKFNLGSFWLAFKKQIF